MLTLVKDTTETSYQDRYRMLKEKKLKHTREKMVQQGYMDADDYGTVPLPENYSFKPVPSDGDFRGYRGWAENFVRMMENHPIYVDPLEIMCGRWRDMLTKYRKKQGYHMDALNFPEDCYPYDHLKPAIDLYGIDSGIGSDSHFCSDYRIGLELGFGGFLEKIRKYRELYPNDKVKQEFYDAEEMAVCAIIDWIQRHIDYILELIEQEDRPEILRTLNMMLAANKNVITKPASNFLEACQYIAWFSSVSRIYDRDGAGCQLDTLLYPYYKKDVDAGIITRDDARFIIANLLLIDTHYYQVSGCDIDGNDLTNDLSYLILEAAHELNISVNLTICVHDKIDPVFFRKAVTYIFTDRNAWPRFCGHKGMMNFSKNQGIDEKTALSRIAVGCGWNAIPGTELPMNDLIKINCVKVFEVAFNECMLAYEEAADKKAYEPSMEKIYQNFLCHLKRAINTVSQTVLFQLEHMPVVMPELVMNLQMKHTIEEGKNISECAEQYTLCCDGVGLGTLADSFAAMEQRVVVEKKISWAELYHAIKTNFHDNERLRLMLTMSERYCQGNSLGDRWAKRISDDFSKLVKSQPMPEGKQLIPGWFSWSKTIHFGKQIGATPNGRKAYEPVTHGANPTPQFRLDGAPSAMSTGIALCQPGYGNTAPFQLEFDPKISVEEGGIERVEKLIRTHFDMGGTLLNINVLDKQTLMDAHANPASHPDLVVRVTGFTAYFCTLSDEFRQLVVDRFVEGA
jgi:formate C-acetyltransferase